MVLALIPDVCGKIFSITHTEKHIHFNALGKQIIGSILALILPEINLKIFKN